MVGTRVVRNAVPFGVCMSDFPDAPWNSRRDLCDALSPALTELAGCYLFLPHMGQDGQTLLELGVSLSLLS